MKEINKFIGFLSLLILSLFSCTNKYEKEAIGKYKISFSQAKDSTAKITLDSSILTLYENNKFSLALNKKIIHGVWNADDNGDYTWIKFSDTNNILLTNGIIGVENIMIFTPSNFYYPSIEKLTYHKF